MNYQKLRTEAGARFSRGVHAEIAPRGVLRGIELMRQTGGGVVAKDIIDEYPLPQPENFDQSHKTGSYTITWD